MPIASFIFITKCLTFVDAGPFGSTNTQQSPSFGNLANQNTVGFGSLAQQASNANTNTPFAG